MQTRSALSRGPCFAAWAPRSRLPFLDAMYPAFAAQAVKKSLRADAHGVPLRAERHRHGRLDAGRASLGATPLGELPRISSALAPYRNDLMILTGLTSDGGRAHGDGPGDHGRAGAAYLTGVHPKKTSGKDIQAGISMDQIAARQLEGKTRFASLELGCEEGIQGGNCDNGYSCAYSNSLSWRDRDHAESAGGPAARRVRAAVRRGRRREGSGAPAAAAELSRRASSTSCSDDAQSLKSTLGGADRRKLDEYLSPMRDIEKRIQSAEQQQRRRVCRRRCAVGERPDRFRRACARS